MKAPVKYTRAQALKQIAEFPWLYLALSDLGAKYALDSGEYWGRPAFKGLTHDDQTTMFALFVMEAES